VVSLIETLFPKLSAGNHRVTSPQTDQYNCIAWAAGVTDKWWWPTGDPNLTHWPVGVPKQETIAAFIRMFGTVGYIQCDSAEFEPGFEKIALFADRDGIPTHAARQLSSGTWTSKLGALEDVEHSLTDLEGAEHGTVAAVMVRSATA
jgi:hypothetical protein